MNRPQEIVECPVCGHRFAEPEARRVCQQCSLFGGCRMIRCPACSHEWQPEPRLVQWLRRLMERPLR